MFPVSKVGTVALPSADLLLHIALLLSKIINIILFYHIIITIIIKEQTTHSAVGCALLFDEGVYFFYYGDYITQHTMIEIIELLQLA